jgi:hypothetical protein
MSSRSSTSSSRSSVAGVGFELSCKHCKNLGVDSNHALRDRAGKLSCPVLLNNVCRRCGKKGHTVSRCVANLSSGSGTAYAKSQSSRVQERKLQSPQQSPQQKNVFASLIDDDDEAAVLPSVRNCTKVLTPLVPLVPSGTRGPTYADILANRNQQIRSPTTTPPRIRSPGINWASNDSDDEQ